MAYLDLRYNLDLNTKEFGGQRHYVTPEGSIYPSMTTILSRYKEPSLRAWKDKVGHDVAERIRDQAASFGTAVHNLCEAYVLGKELPEADPFQIDRFNSIKPVIDRRIGAVYAVETALYSNRLKVAGRTDVIGQFDGVNSVIDYKNASKPKKAEWIDNYFMQGAGYAAMWAERTGDISTTPQQIVVIISIPHDDPQIFIQPVAKWIKPLEDVIKQFGGTSYDASVS